MSPVHKDKHMIGTCPDCPDGLQDKPPSLREALGELLEVADLRGDSTLPSPPDDPILWSARMQTAWDEARAALATPERTGYDLTQEIDRLTIANVNLMGLLRGLTYMGNTPDGRIIIGPHGWRLVQEAIAEAEKE